jgi:hypothetical protein
MPVYNGRVVVGPGVANAHETTRSFIEIGAKRIINVKTSPYLDHFLEEAARSAGESKVGVWSWPGYSTIIAAVRLPNGSRHSVDEDSSLKRGHLAQMILIGVVIAIGGSFMLGLIFGNLAVLACLVGGVLYPFLGLKSLREAKQV